MKKIVKTEHSLKMTCNLTSLKKLVKHRSYTIEEELEDGLYCTFQDAHILCIMCNEDININYVGKLSEKIKEYDRIIIVKTGKVTPTAKTALQEISKMKEVEIFDATEIQYCQTDHELSPKYEELQEQEVLSLLKMYKTSKVQLPILLFSDPVRRYFGWKKGTVVREIHESFIYYRIVL